MCYDYMHGHSAPLTLWSHSCIRGIQGGGMIENVPGVTSLYTPLNLTRMDVALGGRATVERVKWKSRSCFASGHTQMLC